MGTTDALVERMTCRLPEVEEAEREAAHRLATTLLDLPGLLPPSFSVVLGGSLGRGEPNFNTLPDGEIVSDVDLLFVYDGPAPDLSLAQVAEILDSILSDAGGLLVSRDEYTRLPSSLGFDFKEGGISLSAEGVPPWEETVLTPRDGFELFFFSLFLSTWDELLRRLAEEGPNECYGSFARLTTKVLRSAKMALGGYYVHDEVKLPGDLQGLLEALRPDGATKPPADDLARGFLPVCREVLELHEETAGRTLDDAIADSIYVGQPGADFIAREHQICLSYHRRLFDAVGDGQIDTTEIRAGAWAATMAEQPWICGTPTYDLYLSTRKPAIRDQLLLMKLAVSRDGGSTT